MVVGAPTGAGQPAPRWQLYEVRGLASGERAAIAKVAGQPAGYNNVAPLYGSDGQLLFTSDRPRNGGAHLYPQLDEYEATPTVTGIWRLDPASGALRILNHTPSGAFTPILDSYGRVLFTRWDHLQQDQLAERDRNAANNRVALPFKLLQLRRRGRARAGAGHARRAVPRVAQRQPRTVRRGQRVRHQLLHASGR